MPRTFLVTIGAQQQDIREEDIRFRPGPDGDHVTIHRSSAGTAIVDITHRGRSHRLLSRLLSEGTREIWIDRYRVVVALEDSRFTNLVKFAHAAEQVADGCSVKAPMPGLIREIAVRTGDLVEKGQRLLTLEAMKMENEISAPMGGIVGKCLLTPGISVEKDQELIHINLHNTP